MMQHMSRMGWLLGGLCGWSAATAAATVNEHYGAGFEQSVWQVQSGSHQCVLSHEIPHLGEARFIQTASQPLTFSIVVPPEGQYVQQAVLRAVPPLWRHDQAPIVLGSEALSTQRQKLELGTETAQRVYQALESGLFTEILFLDGAEARHAVKVTISAVRFRTVLKEFQTCQAGLIKLPPVPAGKKPVARAATQVTARHPVGFAPDSFELNDAARDLLVELAREYRTGKSTQRILIAGHSDAQDAQAWADRLAVRRAQEIRGYLVRRGLPAERIQIHSTSPVPATADAATRQDLARGATLWLVR